MIKHLLSGAVVLAAATLSSQAAIVLATDFTNVVRTTSPTATGITWDTSSGLSTIDTPNLTITSEYGDGTPAIRTNNNADRVAVNYNVETGGGRSWSTVITFTTASTLDLTNFTVDYHAISGSGGNQSSATKNGNFSFSLFSGIDTEATAITTETLNITDPGAAGAAADYNLSSVVIGPGQYTIKLQVEKGTQSNGNNWAMDDIVLNADPVAIAPEPSSTALLGLGGLALLLRRRK